MRFQADFNTLRNTDHHTSITLLYGRPWHCPFQIGRTSAHQSSGSTHLFAPKSRYIHWIIWNFHNNLLCHFQHSADEYTGSEGIVAGWGLTSEDGPSSCHLRQVNVPILSNLDCRRNTNYRNFTEIMTDNMMCAGFAKGGADSCQVNFNWYIFDSYLTYGKNDVFKTFRAILVDHWLFNVRIKDMKLSALFHGVSAIIAKWIQTFINFHSVHFT